MDKCKYCKANAEHKALVEDNENPLSSNVEDLCSEHLKQMRNSIIDSWTIEEWASKDSL